MRPSRNGKPTGPAAFADDTKPNPSLGKIDGEALLLALFGFQARRTSSVCDGQGGRSEEEDRRRLGRERKVLIAERIRHVNRVKGLLFFQGVSDYEPLRRDRHQRLDEPDNGRRPLPVHFKAQISRDLDRLELLLDHKRAETERDALLAAQQAAAPAPTGKMLLGFRGIGAGFAAKEISSEDFGFAAPKARRRCVHGMSPRRHREEPAGRRGDPEASRDSLDRQATPAMTAFSRLLDNALRTLPYMSL